MFATCKCVTLDGNTTEIYSGDGLWCCKTTSEECTLGPDPWNPILVRQRNLDVLEGILKMRSFQPSHRFYDFTKYPDT